MPYVTANGVRDFTPEEIAEMKKEQERIEQEQSQTPPTPTDAERIAALEESNAEMAEELRAAKILLGLEE